MSTRQLKDLFEAGLASPAPDTIDVDAAVARGRRRRRTRVGATVLASAAAVVVAGLLVAGVLPPRTTGSIAPGDGTPLPIPTSQWKDGDAGMAALLTGVLMLRADRCLVVVPPEAETETVIAWPAGFTAVARDGGADVLGVDGSVVARTGEQIALGGGEGLVGVTGPCLGGPASVFAVNAAPPYERSPATATPAMWTPAEAADDLYGTWDVVELYGRPSRGATDLDGAPLQLRFRANDRGSGLGGNDDGCNGFGADYVVDPDGRFRAEPVLHTLIGCPAQGSTGYPVVQAIEQARTVEIRESATRGLRLLAADGTVLAVYEAAG